MATIATIPSRSPSRRILARLDAVSSSLRHTLGVSHGAGLRLCSWCRKPYGWQEDVQGRTSHGICQACAAKMREEV